jgi:hypothetical protein
MYDLNKKFIFTHPPKCGGTSLEDLFGFLKLREKNPSVHFFKHASLKTHIEKLTQDEIEVKDFFKFSIIRNPWDRAVSFYNHNRYKEYIYYTEEAIDKKIPKHVKDSRGMSFKEFVFTYYKNDFNSEVVTKPYMFSENSFCLDYVIRLENLKEDLLIIKDKGFIDSNSNIPHINNMDQFAARRPYFEYYDQETKNLIAKLFEWDIKIFRYKF